MEYGIFFEFFFSILENLQESTKKIIFSGIFLAFKSKLQVIHVTTYFALFLPDTYIWFLSIKHHISRSVSILFLFLLIFLHCPLRDTSYNLQCLIQFPHSSHLISLHSFIQRVLT